MANPDHLSKLKEGVKEWNKWRDENPDVVPDLYEASLSRETDLKGADLSGANLIGADLCEADLSDANLRNADLRRADLVQAYLNETDLSGANLSDANLSRADLRHAELIRADISEANLGEADLSGANLSEAYIYGANFRNTDLSGVVFRQAEIIRVNLSEANLSGADVSGSRTDGLAFANTDLSNVKGLETVIFYGPSSMGIDTIYASKGKIPEIFLRGAGVPDIFIEYMSSLVCNPLEFYSCFISYSHVDKDFARRLHDRLQGHGIRCWLDEHQLVPGDDLHDRIDRGIKLWDKVILCCSEASLTSWWVDKELDRALQKEERLWKERQEKVLAIIPIDLDGYVHNWESGRAGMVRSRFIGNFQNWKDNDEFEQSFEKLLKALRTPESREPAPAPKL